MNERSELLPQLDELARRVSAMGDWDEQKMNYAESARSGGLAIDGVEFLLKVGFVAERSYNEDSKELETSYSLTSTLSHEVITEELPDFVKQELALQYAEADGDEPDEVFIRVGNSDEDDNEFEDDDDESDESYEHVNEVVCWIDSEGHITKTTITDLYEDDDEEPVSLNDIELPIEPRILSSDGEFDSLDNSPLEPQRLVDELEFNELLGAHKSELYTHDDHLRRVMAMLAFVKYETTAHSIIDVVFNETLPQLAK